MTDLYNKSNHSTILDSENLDNDSACFLPTTRETVHSTVGRLFLVVVYSVASLAALLGNSTVIVVELFGSESAQNIRKYLINLAVADLIIGVFCVPLTYSNFMLGQWIFPHLLCPITQYVQLLSVFVTSIILSFIGVERYLAILHPFSKYHRWLESHTNLLLIIAWTLGATYATIPLKNTSIRPNISHNLTTYDCTYSSDISLLRRRLFLSTNFILTFLLPLVILICTYSEIMRKLMHDQNVINQSAGSDCLSPSTFQLRRFSHDNHQAKIIKMTFIIILLFIVCWMPIKVYQSLFDFNVLEFCTESEYHRLIWMYFACHWTSMASSFVNPIVYSFMSTSFWNNLKNITHRRRSLTRAMSVHD